MKRPSGGLIDKGYAGNQTEVIRQAILAYGKMLEEEEMLLVNRSETMSPLKFGFL